MHTVAAVYWCLHSMYFHMLSPSSSILVQLGMIASLNSREAFVAAERFWKCHGDVLQLWKRPIQPHYQGGHSISLPLPPPLHASLLQQAHLDCHQTNWQSTEVFQSNSISATLGQYCNLRCLPEWSVILSTAAIFYWSS